MGAYPPTISQKHNNNNNNSNNIIIIKYILYVLNQA